MNRHRFNARRESAAVTTFVIDLQERREEQERAARANAAADGLSPCEVDVTPTNREQDVADDLAPLLQASLDQIEKETTGRNALSPFAGWGWSDPACRFGRHPSHQCRRSDGQPLGEHGDCFAEASIGAER